MEVGSACNLTPYFIFTRSAVVGFQLDEMLYATKLTELRQVSHPHRLVIFFFFLIFNHFLQWKDTCIEGVGGLLGVVDSLHEFHSLLVQAAWSGSLAEIDRVFVSISHFFLILCLADQTSIFFSPFF